MPDYKNYESDSYIISTSFQGFLLRGCTYELKEHKYLIFEKKLPDSA